MIALQCFRTFFPHDNYQLQIDTFRMTAQCTDIRNLLIKGAELIALPKICRYSRGYRSIVGELESSYDTVNYLTRHSEKLLTRQPDLCTKIRLEAVVKENQSLVL